MIIIKLLCEQICQQKTVVFDFKILNFICSSLELENIHGESVGDVV